mmetsp:Transcript_74968/g.132610  ORF Transcript_74968/g.132610 Transcript_74968/m.132610 type:complete len:207 (-) Transcript_74968:521-1141(-)
MLHTPKLHAMPLHEFCDELGNLLRLAVAVLHLTLHFDPNTQERSHRSNLKVSRKQHCMPDLRPTPTSRGRSVSTGRRHSTFQQLQSKSLQPSLIQHAVRHNWPLGEFADHPVEHFRRCANTINFSWSVGRTSAGLQRGSCGAAAAPAAAGSGPSLVICERRHWWQWPRLAPSHCNLALLRYPLHLGGLATSPAGRRQHQGASAARQ